MKVSNEHGEFTINGFDTRTGFVDLEFFEKPFDYQARAYMAYVQEHGIIIHRAEPIVTLLQAPSMRESVDLLAYAAEYTAQVNHDPANDYGEKVLNGLCIPAGMEMMTFTFGIQGCSRVFTHQQVRHRLASISQSNSRDRLLPPVFIFPLDYMDSDNPAYRMGEESCTKAYLNYLHMILGGVEPQDARYFLPDTIVQSMVFEIDFKALQALCNQRLCINMQPETSYVAWQMKLRVHEALGERFGRMLRPTCDKIKACLPIQCNVYEGCGKWAAAMPSKTGKRPVSQTSDGNWAAIREYFFRER